MKVDPGSVLESLGPARRFADPEAPRKARLMASTGTLPLPPEQIATILFCLTFDPEAQVQEKARDSLDNLPDRVLDTALAAALPPALLADFAERFANDGARLETIALNAATADETFCMLATLPHPRVNDIVSRNQTRLLRCPMLVEALSENPVTSQATIDRVLEFLGIHTEDAAQPDEAVPDVPEPLPDTARDDAAIFDPDDLEGLPDDLMVDSEDIPDEADEETHASLYSQVQKMSVMQKVKLARFGNGEARALLVRDRNKVVATAAIRSPKLKESEVVTFAKSRSRSDDVLRIIANAREWTRSYQIKQALVMNPKTPLSAAIKFVNYLTDRDLREIMRSRDVPGQIATHARRILSRKGKA